MTITDNKIIVDLRKVVWCKLYYRNQHNQTRDNLPADNFYTWYNTARDKTECLLGTTEYVYDWSLKNNRVDVWRVEVHLRLSTKNDLRYTGTKATSIYKAWCQMQFNKKKK